MRAKKDRGETIAVLEIFVLAFIASIPGLLMGAVIGSLCLGQGKFEPDLHVGLNRAAFAICLVTGGGAGGIIGALAGLARLVQEILDLGHRHALQGSSPATE